STAAIAHASQAPIRTRSLGVVAGPGAAPDRDSLAPVPSSAPCPGCNAARTRMPAAKNGALGEGATRKTRPTHPHLHGAGGPPFLDVSPQGAGGASGRRVVAPPSAGIHPSALDDRGVRARRR